MRWRDQWRSWRANPAVQTALLVTGLLLIVLSPIVGALPGPGGIFVFAGGLALALQNSNWAKRQYVRFKNWQPKAGRWADWGLRRRSAHRRWERYKALREQGESHPERKGSLDRIIPEPPSKPLDQLLKSATGSKEAAKGAEKN